MKKLNFNLMLKTALSISKSKVGNRSRGQQEDFLFNSYYTEVYGRAVLYSLDCSTLPLICKLYCLVLSKEESSTILKVLKFSECGWQSFFSPSLLESPLSLLLFKFVDVSISSDFSSGMSCFFFFFPLWHGWNFVWYYSFRCDFNWRCLICCLYYFSCHYFLWYWFGGWFLIVLASPFTVNLGPPLFFVGVVSSFRVWVFIFYFFLLWLLLLLSSL